MFYQFMQAFAEDICLAKVKGLDPIVRSVYHLKVRVQINRGTGQLFDKIAVGNRFGLFQNLGNFLLNYNYMDYNRCLML